MNILLTPAAQSQLSQLKAINQIPINRIDGRHAAVDKEKTAVDAVSKEVLAVTSALTALESPTTPPTQEAVNAFVKEYNTLQTMLRAQTAKGGTLALTREARDARTDVRNPLSNVDVLSALSALGIETTRDGLVSNRPATATMGLSAIAALDTAFSKVGTELSSASTRLAAKETSLDNEKTRANVMVTRTNARTEKNFLKMYQAMQQMNSSNGNPASLLGGLT